MARDPIWTDAKHLPGLIQRRLREDTGLLVVAARDACEQGVQTAVRLTDREGLVDESHYKQSWKNRPILNGGEVRNDAPHAPVLEYGRRAGAAGPPIEPIREWVHRKLVGNGDVKPEDEEHVAFLIQRKIHTEGSPPHRVLEQTWKKMRAHFERACRRRLKEGRAWGSA